MKRWIIALIILIVFFIGLVAVFFRLFPIKYINEIKVYSSKYGLKEYVVASVINIESGYNEKAVSHAGAMGLMQLKLSTANDMARNTDIIITEDNIFDVDINIEMGCKYIAYLLKMFDGNEVNALASYNWGLQNVKDWISTGNVDSNGTIIGIPVRETEMYLKKYKFCKYIYSSVYGLR